MSIRDTIYIMRCGASELLNDEVMYFVVSAILLLVRIISVLVLSALCVIPPVIVILTIVLKMSILFGTASPTHNITHIADVSTIIILAAALMIFVMHHLYHLGLKSQNCVKKTSSYREVPYRPYYIVEKGWFSRYWSWTFSFLNDVDHK